MAMSLPVIQPILYLYYLPSDSSPLEKSGNSNDDEFCRMPRGQLRVPVSLPGGAAADPDAAAEALPV